MKTGQQSSFRGIGGANMTGGQEIVNEQNDLFGSITHVPVILGQQPNIGYSRARGLPFITTYTGALDPVVAPNLTPAVEDMFHLYDLYDPLHSEYLLTERRSLLEQQRHGVLNDHHFGLSGIDPEWIEADMVLRNLKSEWDEIQDLHQQAQTTMLDRLHEYHNISSLFLPHTRVDQVTAQMVFTKMMRYDGNNVPVKELSQDWLCGLLALLTTSYEDMFLYPFITTASSHVDNNFIGDNDSTHVLTRYTSYLPEASSSPNNLLLDVCEANRQQLRRVDDTIGFSSSVTHRPSVPLSPVYSRPTVTYRVLAPPPVKPPARLRTAKGSNDKAREHLSVDTPPPCGVQEVVIAPQPLPLGPNFPMSELPLGHMLTGGSIGLLAGVLTLYADTLCQRAFGIPAILPPAPSSPRMTRGSCASVAPSAPAPQTSRGRDWEHFEEWVGSGEDILLRRLVLWGVRDGRGHSGSCCSCCEGDADVAVKYDKYNEGQTATSSNNSSTDLPDARTGRVPMNVLSSDGVYGYEDVAVAHRLHQSVTSASFASRRSVETAGKKEDAKSMATIEDYKGLPFTSKEINALFDAIAHYLRTLRKLQYEYQQEQLVHRIGEASHSSYVPQTPQKSKSFLQRLFSKQKKTEVVGNDSLENDEDMRQRDVKLGAGSADSNTVPFPAKRGASISFQPRNEDGKNGRTSKQSEYIMKKTFPTTFQLCIGSNYFYKESMQSEDWIHPQDYDSVFSVNQKNKSQKDGETGGCCCCCDSKSNSTREPYAENTTVKASSSRASLTSNTKAPRPTTTRKRMMHFNYGKEVTPREWKKRQQLEDPYVGGEEEDEEESKKITSEAYHAKSLFRRMTKVLDEWKAKEKKRKEQFETALPEWERDEDLDQMIQLRHL